MHALPDMYIYMYIILYNYCIYIYILIYTFTYIHTKDRCSQESSDINLLITSASSLQLLLCRLGSQLGAPLGWAESLRADESHKRVCRRLGLGAKKGDLQPIDDSNWQDWTWLNFNSTVVAVLQQIFQYDLRSSMNSTDDFSTAGLLRWKDSQIHLTSCGSWGLSYNCFSWQFRRFVM